jgi:hypothetical protein
MLLASVAEWSGFVAGEGSLSFFDLAIEYIYVAY